jgi:hypothetical protein
MIYIYNSIADDPVYRFSYILEAAMFVAFCRKADIYNWVSCSAIDLALITTFCYEVEKRCHRRPK